MNTKSIRRTRSFFKIFFCSTLLFFIVISCGEGGSGNGDGAGGEPPAELTYANFQLTDVAPQTCDTLTLSNISGAPLDSITISGIPAEFSSVAIYIETKPDIIGALYPAGPVSNGEALFIIPVSPNEALEGAMVDLSVTDGTNVCTAIPFAIDPIPAAVTDYDTYMTDLRIALERYLNLVAQTQGTSFDQLDMQNIPPEDATLLLYLAVKVYQEYVSVDPEELTTDEQEWILRLLAKMDALGALRRTADELEVWLAQTMPLNALSVASLAGVLTEPAAAGGGDCVFLDPPIIEIGSTAELSAIMKNPAAALASATFPDAGTINGANWLSGAVGAALGPAATGVAGRVSRASSYIGALGFVLAAASDGIKAAAPSKFTNFSFDVDEQNIWEDKNPPESFWFNAMAGVTSTPFSLTRRAIDGAIVAAGFAGIPGYAIGALSFAYQDEINAQLDKVDKYEGAGCVSIAAQTWGPFEMTDVAWSESEILGSTLTKKTHNSYVPAMLGQSEVRVKILGDKFGGATIKANNFVTVDAKTVSISPISPKVENPGDQIVLTVSVNAYYPEGLEVTPPAGAGDVTRRELSKGVYEFEFNTPDSENLFPAPFRVRSTSPEVPPSDFEREASVNILLRSGLEISGARDCVSPGETVNLEAILTGFSNPDAQTVSWSVTGVGSVTPGTPTRMATYTAPNTEGVVTVKATTPAPNSTTDPPLTDEVEMTVSNACIRQYMAAYMGSVADGDPDCGGPNNNREDIGQDAESIDRIGDFEEENLPEPNEPYWFDRTRTLSTFSAFAASEEILSGGNLTCRNMTSSAYGNLVITTSADGSASWSSIIADEKTCVDTDSGLQCNLGVTGYSVKHYYYLPIRERGTYRLTATADCTFFPHFGLQILGERFIDGDAGQRTFVNGLDSVVTPQNPMPDPPFIQPMQQLEFSCGIQQERTLTMDIGGPIGTSGQDLVTLWYVGSPFSGLPIDKQMENNAALNTLDKDNPEFNHTIDVNIRLERID